MAVYLPCTPSAFSFFSCLFFIIFPGNAVAVPACLVSDVVLSCQHWRERPMRRMDTDHRDAGFLSMLKLYFRDQRCAPVRLMDSRYAIGRDPGNDIVVDEEEVSPLHAELWVETERRVFITDIGSTRGTLVNDQLIHTRTLLKAGDIIRVGRVELELVHPVESVSVLPPPQVPAAEQVAGQRDCPLAGAARRGRGWWRAGLLALPASLLLIAGMVVWLD